MYGLIDYICALFIRALSIILHILPVQFNLWLGRRLAVVAYLFTPERRAIAYANLRAAFCESKSPSRLKKLTGAVYRNLAQVFVEIASLSKVDRKYADKYIDMVNMHYLEKIAHHPDGIIFLTAHFGNWELSAVISAIEGFPLLVLAREQSMKRVNELLCRVRESKGLQVVRKGITTKYIVKALHRGKMIGMLGDQNAGKTGVLIEFFGRPASTAPGAARIAQKTGAYLLPAFITRTHGAYHRLVLEEPVRINKGEDITPHLERYNRVLEKYITEYPEQWLWLHKRWKASSLKKVVILSDGRQGHLNQSLAFSKELKRYREDSGCRREDTWVETEEIKFRSAFRKALLQVCGIFSGKHCQGCMRCMKFCLEKDSYERLMKKYADIVISCGSAVAPVNRLFSVENSAKSAVIMKPGALKFSKFDTVVLPWHDGIKGTPDGSTIVTETVPNLIDEEYLSGSAGKMCRTTNLENRARIGVLFGGDNSDFSLTDEITEKVLANIASAARKLEADILFTTSRRTPKSAERIIEAGLRPEKRCKFLVIANEKNIPDAVAGILGLCDVVAVSGESASMVSEAVTSGKKVVVFNLKKKRKRGSKFEVMMARLKQKGHVTTAEPSELSDAICRAFRRKPPAGRLEDRYNVYKYMWRLL